MMKRLRAAIAPRPVPRSVGERFIGDQKPSTLIGRLPDVHQARLEDFNFNYAEVKQPLDLLKDPKERGVEDKRFHFMSPTQCCERASIFESVIERRVHCVGSETDKDQKVLSTERLRHLYVDVNSLRQRSVVTQSITVPASVAPYQQAPVSSVTPQSSPQMLRQQPYATQQSPQFSGAYSQPQVGSGAPYGSPSAMQPTTGGSPYRAQHAGGAAPMLAPAAYNVPTTSVPSHAQYGSSMNPDQYHQQVYTSVPQQQQQIAQQPMHPASRAPNVSQAGPHQPYYSRTMQYPDGQHGQR
ncbi:hypothetical protein AAVH_34749 [Aphelenchoides avenae]|nr:hypothetical protein AAVH_34749 [Aphelenchus avenae]